MIKLEQINGNVRTLTCVTEIEYSENLMILYSNSLELHRFIVGEDDVTKEGIHSIWKLVHQGFSDGVWTIEQLNVIACK